jgi:hypothetical protein
MRAWCALMLLEIMWLESQVRFLLQSFRVMKWVLKQALPGFECLAGCFA